MQCASAYRQSLLSLMPFFSSLRHRQNCFHLPQSSLPSPARGMLQLWGSVCLSARAHTPLTANSRPRHRGSKIPQELVLAGNDDPRLRKKKRLMKTFTSAAGLSGQLTATRSFLGTAELRAVFIQVHPCSGFSLCLGHPKKPSPGAMHKPRSCTEWP